jgi:hypothetical protein
MLKTQKTKDPQDVQREEIKLKLFRKCFPLWPAAVERLSPAHNTFIRQLGPFKHELYWAKGHCRPTALSTFRTSLAAENDHGQQ